MKHNMSAQGGSALGGKTKILTVVFLLCLLVCSKNALAVSQFNQSGFSVSPYFQNIDVQKSDKSIPFSINVTNITDAPAVFHLSVLDFGTLDESGGVAFLGASDNLRYGLASWVNLPNDTLVLKPGETQTVEGAIENKESLSPGGHYGAIFFKIDDEKSTDEHIDSVTFNPSFASLLFVRKVGGEVYGLNLKNKDFSQSGFVLPDSIRLRFQNVGNVHIAPRGIARLIDPLGREVEKGIINGESALILPETFRVFSVSLMQIASAFVPGRYTLLVNYRYDGKEDFASEQSSFILIPPIFTVSILLGVVITSAVLIIKKRNKK